MSIPDSIEGMSLPQFAELSARMIGLTTVEECMGVVRDAGLDQAAWERANGGWTQKLAEGDPGLVAEHRRLLIAALHRLSSSSAPMSFDLYVELNAAMQAGQPPAEALPAAGHDMKSFSAHSYEWMDRFAADPRLEAYFQVRLAKETAERTGHAERRVGATYGPSDLVRARRCHRCGGVKVTKPSTAYIYCDYCAILFDYDPAVAVSDPTDLDADMVDQQLRRATQDEEKQALESGDRDAYRGLVQWRSEVLTEVCPGAYSPRIREPTYRRAFNADVIAPWAAATAFDAEYCRAATEHDRMRRTAEQSRALADILALLEHAKRLWAHERDLLERSGVFAAHPDEIDASFFVYMNATMFVRPWLSVLADEDRERLLEAASVRKQYIPLPKVDFGSSGCGQCGQELAIPVGSNRFLCEGCGYVLETGRTFPCRQCGAEVALPAGSGQAKCGFCDAVWTL